MDISAKCGFVVALGNKEELDNLNDPKNEECYYPTHQLFMMTVYRG